ncbi:hypothetical protein [Desulfosporosinus sp. SB140]|uniref:hypothetical protein n=1 Tax=Desulfosporosinus paludis TaxID=3115649 RepID=UPI00388DDE99
MSSLNDSDTELWKNESNGVPPIRSTRQEFSFGDAVWQKARPPFVPGRKILGAQAPGKVGYRQVNKREAISKEIVSLCFMVSS